MIVTEIKHVILFEDRAKPGERLKPGDTIKAQKSKLLYNELIFRIDGHMKVSFSGKEFDTTEGSIVFLPKSAENIDYTIEGVKQGKCIDVYFDTEDMLPGEATVYKPKNIKSIGTLFEKMQKTWMKKGNGYKEEAFSLFYEILSEFEKGEKLERTPPRHYSKIKYAADYMDENFSNVKTDMEELAKMGGMSYSYFKRLFNECFEISPVKYLNLKRIEYAKELLLSGKFSVSEAAEKCGFERASYFSRVFKKYVGCSPKKYEMSDSRDGEIKDYKI